MKIEIDNGLGLRLKELTRNGSDIIEAIKTLWDSQSIKLGNLTDELRLYPTDVVKKVQVNGYGNGTGKVLLRRIGDYDMILILDGRNLSCRFGRRTSRSVLGGRLPGGWFMLGRVWIGSILLGMGMVGPLWRRGCRV